MKKINLLIILFIIFFPFLVVTSGQSSFANDVVDLDLLANEPREAFVKFLSKNGYKSFRKLEECSLTCLKLTLGDCSVQYLSFNIVTTPGEYFGQCYCVARNTRE